VKVAHEDPRQPAKIVQLVVRDLALAGNALTKELSAIFWVQYAGYFFITGYHNQAKCRVCSILTIDNALG